MLRSQFPEASSGTKVTSSPSLPPLVMDQNLKTHSGEKSNKCNQCDFASSQAANLRRHLKMHSGEKSANKCNQCDFVTAWPQALKNHLKTHEGEKLKK